ncbi:TAP-like protein-domain-containing protein [Emericellopsis cladophorae]|uniref:TAP-like protein-domain-containing protein n=1 Tax=Emericellopsis cladophorae TaxID=2686198 RepID=A0A9Q0BAS3_9HYPO|nr:TAP-like protein-domain-containing protein [Emericellopsis cladophorae]KAI6779147.1 TAP-like protein-domain-containing protein [Emericellopsis cladophorae]
MAARRSRLVARCAFCLGGRSFPQISVPGLRKEQTYTPSSFISIGVLRPDRALFTSSRTASPALATPLDLKSRQNNANSSGITWGKCHDPLIPGNSSLQCGSLDVPLDYTDEGSGATLALEIVRAPTPKVPSKGSIFFNAGGCPSEMTYRQEQTTNTDMYSTTNNNYDIVNIDTASSTYAGLPLAASAYDTAPANIWVQSQLFVDNCASMQAENGTLIGTAFAARDLMGVVDVLEDDGFLRYWGIPLLRVLLGATVADMFPDKIDKMVLDGVVNPTLYYRNNESETFTSIDDTFSGFCVGCAENPDKCSLAMNQTADEVKQGIFKMLEGLAMQLFAVQQRNLALITEILSAGAGRFNALKSAAAPDSNARDGIKCSDVLTHAANRSEFESVLDARHAAGYFADAADYLPTRSAQTMCRRLLRMLFWWCSKVAMATPSGPK